jgi:polar amino acid transport system permease protein
VLALGVVGAVYAAEIIRSAIESLGKGQFEAALALGFARWRAVLDSVTTKSPPDFMTPRKTSFWPTRECMRWASY